MVEKKKAKTRSQSVQSVPGFYATLAGPVVIKANNGAPYAIAMNKKFQIESYEDGTFGAYYRLLGLFKIRGPLKEISFSAREIENHNVLVAHTPDLSVVAGEKLEPTQIPELWRNRLGDYEIMNPDNGMPIDQVKLEERNNTLQFSFRLPLFSKQVARLTLIPASSADAIIAGLGRGKRETIRTEMHDGVEHLYYSGYEFKRIDSKR